MSNVTHSERIVWSTLKDSYKISISKVDGVYTERKTQSEQYAEFVNKQEQRLLFGKELVECNRSGTLKREKTIEEKAYSLRRKLFTELDEQTKEMLYSLFLEATKENIIIALGIIKNKNIILFQLYQNIFPKEYKVLNEVCQ